MKTKPRKPKIADQSAWPSFDSIASAAGGIGVEQTVLKKAKEAGCPAFKLGSRVDSRELLKWLLAPSKDEGGGTVNWHNRWKKAVAEREEIRLSKDRAEVVNRSNVQQGIGAAVSVLFTELEKQFLAELPPTLVGLDALQIRKVCEDRIGKLRETLRARFAEMTE